MAKDKKQIFIIEFPLKTQKYQENILDTRFEIGRKIYNALVKITQKEYHEMTKTKKWRNGDFILRKEMLKEYHLSEYSFHTDVKNMQHHFKTHIDSSTAQKIGTRLWKAYKKVIFGNGKKVHFQRYGEFNSLEGKSNKTGIRLILKDVPPIKLKKSTGEFKHTIGSGDVGLDIGTQTIAISSQVDVKLFELADKVQNIENKKRLIQRKMDKSRRKTNTDNFNTDGTIKKQGIKIQRDLYSALLIMNINEDLETFNIDKCTTRYDKFYELHNKEVNRLKGQKNLSRSVS